MAYLKTESPLAPIKKLEKGLSLYPVEIDSLKWAKMPLGQSGHEIPVAANLKYWTHLRAVVYLALVLDWPLKTDMRCPDRASVTN